MTLKSLRQAKNMTQSELSMKLGVKRSTLSMWELGLSFPKPETLIPLSEALDCTVIDLLAMKKKTTHNTA